MITYRKKSLKVHNIYPSEDTYRKKYSHSVAEQLKDFIEKGEYTRIVEIFMYGQTNRSLVCSIIYEQAKKGGDNEAV